jgi:hypothetical protein
MRYFTAINLPQLSSAMEYQAVKCEAQDFRKLLVEFVETVFLNCLMTKIAEPPTTTCLMIAGKPLSTNGNRDW